ncbi:hypothetical protein EVAR_63270_1 [Eumeta japonica]|uniref:Uncharacterized protein n=1 Tax=Eumeta variegata TaxID=151549 RepID=A0A4C1YZ38_EUMVA|nr:hypothetical protein EVAR_63270_1 [Eumeta japonica]
MLQQDPDSSLAQFTTMNETWFHHCYPDTKLQSKLESEGFESLELSMQDCVSRTTAITDEVTTSGAGGLTYPVKLEFYDTTKFRFRDTKSVTPPPCELLYYSLVRHLEIFCSVFLN